MAAGTGVGRRHQREVAGDRDRPPALESVSALCSSGWRSASSASRRNSPSSSRKRMPRWALVTSPGLGGEPPPIRAFASGVVRRAEGPRHRRRDGAAGLQAPAIRITSRASACSSGGISEGSRRAARVLPARRPGQQQAVAARGRDLQARRRVGCPSRSARSGPRDRPRRPAPSDPGCGTGSRVPSGERGKPGHVIERDHLQALDQRRLGGVLGRDGDPAQPLRSRPLRHRQRPGTGRIDPSRASSPASA